MDDPFNALIEYLNFKGAITPLEQDILDTWNELHKDPFDGDSESFQMWKNDKRYPDIFVAIAALPTTVQKPWTQLSDEDLRYNLSKQLTALFGKEQEDSTHVQQT